MEHPNMQSTREILVAVKSAGQDFEWYPTTQKMIDVVARQIPCGEYSNAGSFMDIGAGDGRVLAGFEKNLKARNKNYLATLYAIEKSSVLLATWPENIIPVGCDFFEQNLACLPVDYIYSNPPYSEYETWVTTIIDMGYAKKAFLVIPDRWTDSAPIAAALKKRKATVRIIHKDDFLNAERQARAVINILEISYPQHYEEKPDDPFDIWFDENVDTFDHEKTIDDAVVNAELAKKHDLNTVVGLVDAFNEEYQRMQDNYKAIFKLDMQILKELGVNKSDVREGLKKRMSGLKTKYWQLLFEKLTAITSRLCTETKKKFCEKLTGRVAIAFTASNAYSVVIWAIKNANKYFDEQLIKLFKELSCQDSVRNYKSNQRVWEKDAWRFRQEEKDHYALDYQFVVDGHTAIDKGSHSWDYPNGLHVQKHELIEDAIAVLGNLGFNHTTKGPRSRTWVGGQ